MDGFYLLEMMILLSIGNFSSSKKDNIDPCLSYTELRDAHRSQHYKAGDTDSWRCDHKLALRWYRFRGKAGLKMPESCVATRFCGTHSPGWLKGSHPSAREGTVSRNVCFNWMGNCCYWLRPVKVKNCSGFYVYRLPRTSFCDMVYCGDGAPDLECTADNNDIVINGSTYGSLLSRDGTAQYPSNCTWRIRAPVDKRVRLVLKNMTLGAQDYVMFRDGFQDSSPLIGNYTGCANGELRLYSTNQSILVRLVYYSRKFGMGLELDYQVILSSQMKCFPYKDICSLTNYVRALSGIIRSPGLPRSPPGDLDCNWTLLVPAGYKVLVSFSWFGLTYKSKEDYCADDYVALRMEGKSHAEEYCGCDIPSKLLHDRNTVHATFYTNKTANKAGFMLFYRAVVAEECLDGVESCEINMPAAGMNANGDLCYDAEDVPTTTQPPIMANTTENTLLPATNLSVSSQLKPSTTTSKSEGSLDVTCGENDIRIVLRVRSTLRYEAESVRLNNPACRPHFQNKTHIFISTALEACATTFNISEDGQDIVYQNAIHVDVVKASLGPYTTRDHQAVFVFQCSYKRLAVVSAVSFNPALVYVITNTVSFGNFTFEMNMFKSKEYNEYYTEYPVGPVELGTTIYLQVAVKANDSELVVFVDECKATPTGDYDDQTQYKLIEKGCAKDNTLQYNYTLSPVQHFTLSAFRFRDLISEEIFLHCQVKACRRSDLNSPCAKGCPFGKRRKRSSEHEIGRYLAIGPIIVSYRGLESKQDPDNDDGRPKAFEAVAAVLGFAAIFLITALLVLILKRRTSSNPETPPTLLIHDDGFD